MEFILPLILACVASGALTAFVTSIFARKRVAAETDKAQAEAKKTAAEANEIVVNSAVKMVAEMRAEIARLSARVDYLEKENEKLAFQLEAVRRGY